MNDNIFDGLVRALADHCDAPHVRAIENGDDPAPLWQRVSELGYADAFVAESDGGIGLAWPLAFDLCQVLGRADFPLPLAETAVARALLAAAGHAVETTAPIVLADSVSGGHDKLAVADTPGLAVAGHLMLQHDGHWHLLPLDAGRLRPGAWRPRLSAALDDIDLARAHCRFAATQPAAALLAPLQAAEMAGAMAAVVEMTLTYAGERRQFGRAIGQFQALQQEMALMAEQLAFAVTAARLGFAGSIGSTDQARGACARIATCDAAEQVLAIAHAVHGAIGITEEYRLGPYARRLQEWRHAAPAAGHGARQLGSALLDSGGGLLDFVRAALPAA